MPKFHMQLDLVVEAPTSADAAVRVLESLFVYNNTSVHDHIKPSLVGIYVDNEPEVIPGDSGIGAVIPITSDTWTKEEEPF